MEPRSLMDICVKVGFRIGHIDEILGNNSIKDKTFKGSKYKNFLNELMKETQEGKLAAVAINLCYFKDGLRKFNNRPELQEAISNAIWQIERAIDAIYEYEGANPTIVNPFFIADSSDDD